MRNSIFRTLAGLLSVSFISVGIMMLAMGELKFPIVAIFQGVLFGLYAFLNKDLYSKEKEGAESHLPSTTKEIRIKYLKSLLWFILLSIFLPYLIYSHDPYSFFWWLFLALGLFFAYFFYSIFWLFLYNHGLNPKWAISFIYPLIILVDIIIHPYKYYEIKT